MHTLEVSDTSVMSKVDSENEGDDWPETDSDVEVRSKIKNGNFFMWYIGNVHNKYKVI